MLEFKDLRPLTLLAVSSVKGDVSQLGVDSEELTYC